jgi:hypothetical protein
MSAAACKIIIDCAALLIGKLMCLAGSAQVADSATPGSVTLAFAQRFQSLANEFGDEVDEMIDELGQAIPEGETEERPGRGRKP